MERGRLAQQLGPRARIGDLVRCGAGILIGRQVADAFAAGLDRVHLDGGELGQNIGRLLQLDPIVLDVLPRREMAVAAIICAGDMAEHPHLPAVQRPIGDGDAQHIGVKLQIEAVLQAQRLELILGHFAGDAAADLIAEFVHAGIDDRLVVFVVSVHVR